MSEAIEDIPTMTPTERLVQLLEREESNSWQKADATYEAVEAEKKLTSDSLNPTGHYDAINKVWQKIMDAHIPTEPPPTTTINGWYLVAKAWPEETRVEGASYIAHYRLAGNHWANRQGILSKIVAKTRQRNGPDAVATENDVMLWKQTVEPPPTAKPWDEKFYRRLDSLIHSGVGPKSKAEWQTAISLVKQLLDEMREEAENAK